MGKTNIAYTLVTILLGMVMACTEGDNAEENIEAAETKFNLTLSAMEYSPTGSSLGNLESGLSGDLAFNLTASDLDGALEIDPSTGSIEVKNGRLFDFENQPTFESSITVSNGTEEEQWTLTVRINDIDDIGFWLDDSQTAYESARGGSWVSITATEYAILATEMAGISKVGTTDGLYEQGSTAERFTIYEDLTASNDLSSIPENSYLFAFKYLANADNIQDTKVKVTQGSVAQGYFDVGSPLPQHGMGEQYFVLKKAGLSTTNSRGFLGVYTQVGLTFDTYGRAAGTHYIGEGDVNTLDLENGPIDKVCIYQGLTTALKQWD